MTTILHSYARSDRMPPKGSGGRPPSAKCCGFDTKKNKGCGKAVSDACEHGTCFSPHCLTSLLKGGCGEQARGYKAAVIHAGGNREAIALLNATLVPALHAAQARALHNETEAIATQAQLALTPPQRKGVMVEDPPVVQEKGGVHRGRVPQLVARLEAQGQGQGQVAVVLASPEAPIV